MSKNHFGPGAFGLPKVDDAAAATISDVFPVQDMTGILLYAEFHQPLSPTTLVPTSVVATDVDEVGATCVVRPWVRSKVQTTYNDEKEDAWMPLAETTLTAIAHTANQPPPVITDAARSVATMVTIPNGVECMLELVSVSADNVTIWGAPVERAPA